MTKDELIEKTDKAISELVCTKTDLLKAYNYYNGVRDKELFRYLEETYGTNTPTAIHFTPLIKKHIDAIIGEYLGVPIIPKVYCKDSETIANIDREKQLTIAKEMKEYLKTHLQNAILRYINGKSADDGQVELQLKSIEEEINTNFVSQYEIASLNVIEYIMQSRTTDLSTVLRNLIFDLLNTGYTFYKVEPTVEKNNIKIRPLNPLDTFIERNPESPYVKDSTRAVVRSWLSKQQILNKYGKEMTPADRELIETKWESLYDNSLYYIKSCTSTGILAGVETTPGYPDNKYSILDLKIPVYEVEWLETDKDFVMNRYETIRIGEEVYILRGKNEQVIRSQTNPSYCTLSINGVYFLNRGSEPYSLTLKCAHLQD